MDCDRCTGRIRLNFLNGCEKRKAFSARKPPQEYLNALVLYGLDTAALDSFHLISASSASTWVPRTQSGLISNA